LVAAVSLSLAPFVEAAQPVASEAKTRTKERLRPSGIAGALVIGGGGKPSETVLGQFVKLAGAEKARLVVISVFEGSQEKEPADEILQSLKACKPASVTLLSAPTREAASARLLESLTKATGVWIAGKNPTRSGETFLGTALGKELPGLLERGGAIGGTSGGAAVVARLLVRSGNPLSKTAPGLGLLPESVIALHSPEGSPQQHLFDTLAKNPGLVGFDIEEGAALVVQGRELRVLGDGTVTVCLGPSSTRAAKTIPLNSGSVADLTAFRRAAIARSESPFPPKEAPVPEVPNGSLVIVGGGGVPADVTEKFIELAGGPDALIVVLPTANPDPIPANSGAGFFERAGAHHVKVLRARELKDVEAPESLDLLKNAKGIWFGGGRQWRFVDAYEGTKAEALMRDVLRRGGVIGGSSAGATIQGDYLCRGSPLGNLEIMYEGYERGLGFLPGVAIDQHFSQRKRFADMTALMKTYPQLLGIGIDESTALIVTGHVAQIMGKNNAHFYNRTKPALEGEPDYETVKPGEYYDLKLRSILPPAAAKPAEERKESKSGRR
jgi:cyanophycinase